MAELRQTEAYEKVVQISRVAKKTSGGNRISFSALVVVGDKQGRVGVALGKARGVPEAVRKATTRAKKSMILVPLKGTTIPVDLRAKRGAAEVLLMPAPRGSGIIAGGPVRVVVEACGIEDISAKILGTNNKVSNIYATYEALRRLKDFDKK